MMGNVSVPSSDVTLSHVISKSQRLYASAKESRFPKLLLDNLKQRQPRDW